MHMLVDKPRHQALALGVDDGEIVRVPVKIDLWGDLDDLLVADQDVFHAQILGRVNVGFLDQNKHGVSSVYFVIMRKIYIKEPE